MFDKIGKHFWRSANNRKFAELGKHLHMEKVCQAWQTLEWPTVSSRIGLLMDFDWSTYKVSADQIRCKSARR